MVVVKFRIIKDYKRCSNAVLLARASNVHSSMSSNTFFPSPPVRLDALNQMIAGVEAAIVDAQYRDRLKSAQKNALVAQLVAMLDQLAAYVTQVANGDEIILISSGFTVSGGSATGASFGPVENFVVEIGPGSGNVTVSVNKIPRATNYALFYGIDNGANTIWQYASKPKRKFMVKNLEPGKTYVFKMRVTGANDREVDSEIITKIVA